jgi:hypothetical protein
MKILAFTDVHAKKQKLEKIKQKAIKEKPDFLVCSGDLSIFGSGLEESVKFLMKLNIPMLIIPGNHEIPEDIKLLQKKHKNIINLHAGAYDFEDYTFFGWGTGGFSLIEEKFERTAEKFKKDFNRKRKLIFITHAPFYNTKLDFLSMGHRGCKSTRKFVEEMNPIIGICGHFHENFNKKDMIKKTLIMNPGPEGTIIEFK